MKKSYLFGMFALAAMTMVGCSNDEVVENFSQDNAIEFGTYVGRDAQSRAEIFDNSDLQAEGVGFGVYAFYTGQDTWENYVDKNQTLTPNFMNNTQVTYVPGTAATENTTAKEGSWTYSPLKYWPNNVNDKVSFFAYAPYVKNNDKYMGIVNGVIDFKVPNNIADQIDLTAVTDHKINQTKTTLDQKVEFAFKHVLTRFNFTLQAAADQVAAGGTINEGTTITLNKIIIGSTEQGEGGFYERGNYSMLDNTWSDCTGQQAFTLEAEDFIANSNVLTAGENGNGQKNLIAEDGDQHIMIIPQECYNLPVYVEYTVKTEGKNAIEQDDSSEIVNKITSYIKGIVFDANRIFNFHIVLGMSTVELAATVEGWNGGEHHEIVDLPLNVE